MIENSMIISKDNRSNTSEINWLLKNIRYIILRNKYYINVKLNLM